MSDINTQMAVLENKMENIERKVDEGFRENSEQHRQMMEHLEKAIDQKAGKWVEKVLIGLGAAVGMAVLASIMNMVLIGG